VVHEAVKSFSVSAEIITRLNEAAFYNLKVAPSRLTGWDITVPYAQGEKYHIITPERIADRISTIMKIEE
ncbi:MAG: transketolase C-terminal domain-containing protein, partial [Malacoplasma sp.]